MALLDEIKAQQATDPDYYLDEDIDDDILWNIIQKFIFVKLFALQLQSKTYLNKIPLQQIPSPQNPSILLRSQNHIGSKSRCWKSLRSQNSFVLKIPSFSKSRHWKSFFLKILRLKSLRFQNPVDKNSIDNRRDI